MTAGRPRWRKRTRWIRVPLRLAALRWRNLRSQDTLLDAAGPVVSLTSYGERIARAHHAIESIGLGTLRPSRLVLWLAQDELDRGLPAPLRRLQRRGLVVAGCPDWGPHKKYYPEVVAGLPAGVPLVTADDDVLYPPGWLASLVAAWRDAPQAVACHRARRIGVDAEGRLLPYRQWPGCFSDAPSALNFSVGGSGVLYPPAMCDALRAGGTAFMDVCPRADDIWLNATAQRQGVPVRQVTAEPVLFDDLPGTRRGGLARENVRGGGNDRQIAATFSAAERDALARRAAADRGGSGPRENDDGDET